MRLSATAVVAVWLVMAGFSASASAEPACKNPTGKGKNFVYACDEVCADGKTDVCAGIYWKDSRGSFKKTKYRKLLKRCTSGVRTTSPEAANICGCGWYYPRKQEQCYLNHLWQVDCNTFCFHERINPAGSNCQGLVWTDAKGRWGGATFKAGRCWATTRITTLGRSVARSFAKNTCGSCDKVPVQVRPRKTAAEIERDKKTPMTDATARYLTALRDQVASWVLCADLNACARGPNGEALCRAADVKPCRAITAPGALKVRMNSDFCDERIDGVADPFCSPSGDMVYESGINCLAGNMDRCNEIKASQDREGRYGPKGAWYRNPNHMRHTKGPNSVLFSRDQSLGVLEYLIRTKDKVAAELWFNFIGNNRKLIGGTMWNLCPERAGAAKTDDRCRVLPDNLALYYRVLEYIGFDMNKLPIKLGRAMRRWRKINTSRLSVLVSSFFVRVRTGTAFEGSLQVRAANILDTIGMGSFRTLGRRNVLEAAKRLDRRSGQINAGWHFIANGRQPTEYVGWLLRQFCTAQKPAYGSIATSWGILNRTQGRRIPGNMFFSTANHRLYPGSGQYGGFPVNNGHECADVITYVLDHRGRRGPSVVGERAVRKVARQEKRQQRRAQRAVKRQQRQTKRVAKRTQRRTKRTQRKAQRRARRKRR